MKNIFLLFVLFLFCSSFLIAQPKKISFEWKGYIPLAGYKLVAPLTDNSIVILEKSAGNNNYTLVNYDGINIRWKKSLPSILVTNGIHDKMDKFSTFQANGDEISFVLMTIGKKKRDFYLVTLSGIKGETVNFKKFTTLQREADIDLQLIIKTSENKKYLMVVMYSPHFVETYENSGYISITDPIRAFVFDDRTEIKDSIFLEKKFGYNLKLEGLYPGNQGELITMATLRKGNNRSVEIFRSTGDSHYEQTLDIGHSKIDYSFMSFYVDDYLHLAFTTGSEFKIIEFTNELKYKIKWKLPSSEELVKKLYPENKPSVGAKYKHKGNAFEGFVFDEVVKLGTDLLFICGANSGKGRFNISNGILLMRFNQEGELVWNDFIIKYYGQGRYEGNKSYIISHQDNKLLIMTNEKGNGYIRSLDLNGMNNVSVPYLFYDDKQKYLLYTFSTWSYKGDFYLIATDADFANDNFLIFYEASKLNNFK